MDNDPTHHLAAIPWAKLDEDFTSGILFSVLGQTSPYFFLVEREDLFPFLEIVKAEDKENARFLAAEFLYFDFEIFGTQDSLLQNRMEELEIIFGNSRVILGGRLPDQCYYFARRADRHLPIRVLQYEQRKFLTQRHLFGNG